MVLYLDEYIAYLNSTQNKNFAVEHGRIKKFNSDKKYLHELSAPEILAATERYGGNSPYTFRKIIIAYLNWLSSTYAVNTTNLVYAIENSGVEGVYIGVYDANDLITVVDNALEGYELSRESLPKGVPSVIEQNVKTLYYLEWYGVNSENILSIRLSDVKDKGRTIFVPTLNKNIHIDNEVIAEYINDWTKTDEIKTRHDSRELYLSIKGDNLLRNTRGNCGLTYVNKIHSVIKDPRLGYNKVCYAGAFHRMYELENEQGDVIEYLKNEDYLKEEFYWLSHNKQSLLGIIRLYRVYKDFYLKWMSENKNK